MVFAIALGFGAARVVESLCLKIKAIQYEVVTAF
jgi:hypothetical protein